MTAVLEAPEFQSDPIKTLTTHLRLALGPAPEQQAPLKKLSKRGNKVMKQRRLDRTSAPDATMSLLH